MAQLETERNALVCTSDGIFILPGRAIVERRGNAFVCASQQEICNLAASLYGAAVVYGSLFPTIERATRFLESGSLEKAQKTISDLELPPLTTLGENLLRLSPAIWRKEWEPDDHPRWPAGSSEGVGGQFSPKGSGDEQVAQEMLFARPPIDDVPQLKETIPRLSGKDGAKDAPSWARGMRPYVGENGRDFAKRILDDKYGPGNWSKSDKEYGQLQKYGDRNFRDPKAIAVPDDNEA